MSKSYQLVAQMLASSLVILIVPILFLLSNFWFRQQSSALSYNVSAIKEPKPNCLKQPRIILTVFQSTYLV